MIFESFSVILRQISLGVPTVRRRSFSLSYEKILQKSRFLGLFGDTASNFTRSTDSTPSLIFLVLRKNPSKIETLGLFGDTASNFTRSTFARCHSFSLSYEKILQKSRFWVFSEILRQISLGVHSYAVVHFPCLTKKSCKNRDFWVFAVTLGQISLGVHSHAVIHFPCLTKKSFKNRDFGSFLRYCDKYHLEYIHMPSFIFRQSDQVCNALYI